MNINRLIRKAVISACDLAEAGGESEIGTLHLVEAPLDQPGSAGRSRAFPRWSAVAALAAGGVVLVGLPWASAPRVEMETAFLLLSIVMLGLYRGLRGPERATGRIGLGLALVALAAWAIILRSAFRDATPFVPPGPREVMIDPSEPEAYLPGMVGLPLAWAVLGVAHVRAGVVPGSQRWFPLLTIVAILAVFAISWSVLADPAAVYTGIDAPEQVFALVCLAFGVFLWRAGADPLQRAV
jgi:hypothetical protein